MNTLHENNKITKSDYKPIPINEPRIDSLMLRIELDKCKILETELISTTAIFYHDTQEINDEILPPAPYKFVIDGVIFRVQIKHIPQYNRTTGKHESKASIEIVLTSKLLRERYFECINKDNIKYFYERFMSFKLFHCSYSDFLNSYVSDIDICINRYASNKQDFVKILNSLYIQSGNKQRYLKPPFTDANNIGLVMNTRYGAKPSLPFVKLYHKETELLNKSVEFYNTYLQKHFSKEIKNLTRIECTIKNYAHKKRLISKGIINDFTTLNDLLNIPQTDLKKFVLFSIEEYIMQRIRKRVSDLSPTDHIIFETIQTAVILGADFETILNCFKTFKGTSPQTTANGKTRIKKRVKYLYDLLIHKDIKIEIIANSNKNVIEYLKYLGLNF